MDNPLEKLIYDYLKSTGMAVKVDGTKGEHGATRNLDFYLPELDIYIEVTAFYTPRKIEQMSRAENVILIQGAKAAKLFASL